MNWQYRCVHVFHFGRVSNVLSMIINQPSVYSCTCVFVLTFVAVDTTRVSSIVCLVRSISVISLLRISISNCSTSAWPSTFSSTTSTTCTSQNAPPLLSHALQHELLHILLQFYHLFYFKSYCSTSTQSFTFEQRSSICCSPTSTSIYMF